MCLTLKFYFGVPFFCRNHVVYAYTFPLCICGFPPSLVGKARPTRKLLGAGSQKILCKDDSKWSPSPDPHLVLRVKWERASSLISIRTFMILIVLFWDIFSRISFYFWFKKAHVSLWKGHTGGMCVIFWVLIFLFSVYFCKNYSLSTPAGLRIIWERRDKLLWGSVTFGQLLFMIFGCDFGI